MTVSLKILIIDTDRNRADRLCQRLRGAGHVVTLSSSQSDAACQLRAPLDRVIIHLEFSDDGLRNGLELYHRLCGCANDRRFRMMGDLRNVDPRLEAQVRGRGFKLHDAERLNDADLAFPPAR